MPPGDVSDGSTVYYLSADNLTTNTFRIAATQAAAIAGTGSIATSGSQSGTITCTAPSRWLKPRMAMSPMIRSRSRQPARCQIRLGPAIYFMY